MLHNWIAKFIEIIFPWLFKERQICATLQEDLFVTKSAVEIAELIRKRERTATEVVQAYIRRLQQVNPRLNGIVDGPFTEEAIEEARNIDERMEKGLITEEEFNRKPFLGVPFTTKDSTAVKGKLQTMGLVARSNARSTEDAECVRLMKEAGAIIIATSNIPELNRWIETRNNVVGQTNNPYDNRRTAGGSSGGEGVLISSCGSCIGLGTDIGGSIRFPAFYCGIFGHKPTGCAINLRGCTFKTGDETETMVVAGPMSRYATDLLPMMKVLADPRYEARLQLGLKVNVKKLRYYYCDGLSDNRIPALSNEMKEVMRKVAVHLEEITGNTCQKATFQLMKDTKPMYVYWLNQEPGNYRDLLHKGFNPRVELLKLCFGKSRYSFSLILSALIQKPIENPEEMRKASAELKQEFDDLLGDDGVLIFPSSNDAAGYHYSTYSQFYKINYFAIFNILRVPVTQVPIGLDKNGLPLGVQVVASAWRDRDCIAVAEELERTFGGWVPPFKIEKS